MHKKKVLFLIESMSGGGAEKVLSTLLQHIDYIKFDITLCCICNTGKYIDIEKPYVNFKYIMPEFNNSSIVKKILYKLKYKLIYNWLPLKWVYQWFIPHHSDIEIAFVEGFTTKLLSHSSNRKAKRIAWVHCDMLNFHWTESLFKSLSEEETCYQSYHQIITVSDTAKKSFKKQFTNVSKPVITLYNPINSIEIIEKSSETIPMSPKNDGTIRIVSTGRLTAPKAYDRLIRIVSKLIQENYNIELWLLGDGELRKNLENIIKELHLENVVTLLGFQSNPYAYLSKCDLFVCSSISEGYSTAVTEALILGLPVITTDCSGMHELLKNGESGIITENSEEALYIGLKELLNNPLQLKELKEEAELRGKEFSLNNLIKSIEKLLMLC